MVACSRGASPPARAWAVFRAYRVGCAPRGGFDRFLQDAAEPVRAAQLDQTAEGALDVAGRGVDERRGSLVGGIDSLSERWQRVAGLRRGCPHDQVCEGVRE